MCHDQTLIHIQRHFGQPLWRAGPEVTASHTNHRRAVSHYSQSPQNCLAAQPIRTPRVADIHQEVQYPKDRFPKFKTK